MNMFLHHFPTGRQLKSATITPALEHQDVEVCYRMARDWTVIVIATLPQQLKRPSPPPSGKSKQRGARPIRRVRQVSSPAPPGPTSSGTPVKHIPPEELDIAHGLNAMDMAQINCYN
jgi:hypothetical protein